MHVPSSARGIREVYRGPCKYAFHHLADTSSNLARKRMYSCLPLNSPGALPKDVSGGPQFVRLPEQLIPVNCFLHLLIFKKCPGEDNKLHFHSLATLWMKSTHLIMNVAFFIFHPPTHTRTIQALPSSNNGRHINLGAGRHTANFGSSAFAHSLRSSRNTWYTHPA